MQTFISIIAGAIVVIFASWSAHLFSIRRDRRQEFNKAAVDFQCAFLEARQRLRDEPKADFIKILDSKTLLEHEKAALRFQLFLSDKDRRSFCHDWNIYFSHNPHPGDRHPPEKAPVEWNNEKNCKKFLEEIETLFTYAKIK